MNIRVGFGQLFSNLSSVLVKSRGENSLQKERGGTSISCSGSRTETRKLRGDASWGQTPWRRGQALKKTLLAATFTVAFGAAGFAGAQTWLKEFNLTMGTDYTSGAHFDCKSLYGSTDTTTGYVYKLDLDAAPMGGTIPAIQVYRAATTAGTPNWGTGSAGPLSTIALGRPNILNNPNAPLQMWHWSYYNDPYFSYVKEGDTSAWHWGKTPVPTTGSTGTGRYWSGGEFNQKTGQIYLSSGQGATLSNTLGANTTGKFGIFDPMTGDYKFALRLERAPGTAPLPSNIGAYGLSSDMAVDANGNIYNVVGDNTTRKMLIRVVPGEHDQVWYYNQVVPINSPITMNAANWGMAFLNGKLYITGTTTSYLTEIDLFSGTSVRRGTYGPSLLDLASCQMAPVIQGVVYNDTSGTGSVTPGVTPGAEGVLVSIYKDEGGVSVYKGSHTTDATGYYSFLVDSTDATFYIRVEQPKIGGATSVVNLGTPANPEEHDVKLGGVNATQTWARTGGTLNPVTAFCVNNSGVTQEVSASGPCRGTRWSGSDPAGPRGSSKSGTAWDITQAQIYSKVVMTTDYEVADVDFAISAVASYGDAPSAATFRSLWANGGPAHVIAYDWLRLGNTVLPYTDGIETNAAANRNTTDDGVFVLLRSVDEDGVFVQTEVPLQDVPLANSKQYRIRAKVSGDRSTLGYLNMWDNSAGTAPVLKTTAPGLQDTGGTGKIEFDYTTRATMGDGYARFRFSTTGGLLAQSATATPIVPGAGQQAFGSTDATKPWVVDGEVEDYRFRQVTSLVRLVAMSKGGAGTFTYTLGNISATAPSVTSSSITTPAANIATMEGPPNNVHSIQTNGTAVTITQALPTPTVGKWNFDSVSCVDYGGAAVTATVAGNVVTIPGAATALGADITCVFTNRLIIADADHSELNVTPAGPVYTTGTYTPNSYTVKVTARDETDALQGGVEILLTFAGGTLTATGVGTYAPGAPGSGTCTTSNTPGATFGACEVTWTSASPSTPGAFTINATLDGKHIGAYHVGGEVNRNLASCNAANKCSPQSRVFQRYPNEVDSTLVVTPTGPIYTSSSYTATVTAKNSDGTTLPGVPIALSVTGSTTLTGTGTGTFVAGTCTTGAAGTCVVTWTSTIKGTFTISATLAGAPITGSPQNKEFVTDPVASQSELTASKTTVTADGTDLATLTVTLKDSSGATTTSVGTTTITFGNSAPGTFYAPGTSTPTTTCTIPNGSSSCSVDIKSTKSGTTGPSGVTAQLGGASVKFSPLAITFIAGPEDCDKSTLTATPSTLEANGTSTSTVTITLMDKDNNLVLTEKTVNFSLPSLTYGSFPGGLTTASCKTSPTTGACSVTYTTPSTMPPPGGPEVKFNITATLECGSKTREITLSTSPNGKITVTKTVIAEPGGYVPGGKFDINVSCGTGYTKLMQLAHGESDEIVAPLGNTCTLTETVPTGVVNPGFINKATHPSSITVSAVRPISVVNTITQNTTPPFTLTVTKTVSGAVAQHNPDAMFAIYVSCDGDGDTKIVNLMRNEIGRVDVNAGSRCTISEPSLAGTPPTPATLSPLTHRYYPNISPEVIAKVDSNRSVEVNNVIDGPGLGKVTLTNAVTGDPTPSAFNNAQNFTVTLGCGTGYSWISAQRVGDVSSYYAPIGNTCNNVTATGRPAILDTTLWQWGTTTYTPPSGFAVVAAGVLETVTHPIEAVTDAAYSTLVITPAGPLGTNPPYPVASNTYTVTVTAKNVSEVPQPGQVIMVTVDGGTLAGTGTGTFVPGTGACTTGASGTCVMTWTSATASPTTSSPPGFTIHATMGGTDIGAAKLVTPPQNVTRCTAENICSPQVRVFYGPIDPNQWTLTASPTSLITGQSPLETSTITATVKDANGNLVLTQTDVTFASLAAGYGSLSALTCKTQDGTGVTPGACSVTYTSPMSVPAGGKATVTASVAGITGNKTVDINLNSDGYFNVYVKKTVTGPDKAAGYVAGGKFTVNVICSPTPAAPTSLSLADLEEGYVVVKSGSSCQVAEVIPPATSVVRAGYIVAPVIAPSRLTVSGGDETVEIVNRITTGDPGEMLVSKVVTGDPNDFTNGHIPSNQFGILVNCTGTNLPPANFKLKNGQTATVVAGLGNECTISEPGLAGTPQVPAAISPYKYAPSIEPSYIEKLPASRTVTVTNTVTTKDTYPVTMKNVVIGDQSPSLYNNNAYFAMKLVCGTFNTDSQLFVNERALYSVDSGVTCNVSLVNRPAILNPLVYQWKPLTPSSYSLGNSFLVNGSKDEVVTHELERTPFWRVNVTKTVIDPVGGYVPNGQFVITLNCGSPAYTKVMNLANGGSDYLDVPRGNTCTLTEAEPTTSVVKAGFGNSYVISPSRFTVNADMTAAVTNRIGSPIEKATLEVTKEVTGYTAEHISGNVFLINVACASTVEANFYLQDGWMGTMQGKVGDRCTITEPGITATPQTPAPNPNYQYVPNNTGTMTLQADAGNVPGNKLTIQNRVVQGPHVAVTLINAVTYVPGPAPATPAFNQTQPFVLTMDCGPGYVWNNVPETQMPPSYIGDEKKLYVPLNASCTMGTASRPAIVNTIDYKWETDPATVTTYNPTSPFTAVASGVTETATHKIIPSTMRNIYVVKTVTGGTTDTTFTIKVDCGGGNTKTMNLKHGESDFIQARDGSVCTVIEESVDIGVGKGYTALIVPSEFTVRDDMTVANSKAVKVENRIEVTPPPKKAIVKVTKRVNGATGQHIASNMFNIRVACNKTTLANFSLLDGDSASVEGEVDQVCTITEPDPLPTLGGGYFYAPSIVPSTSRLPEGILRVTVTNTVVNTLTHKVTLTNAVTGEPVAGAYNHDDPFVLTFNCGGIYNFGEVSMVVGAISIYSIPNGSSCTTDTVKAKLPVPTNPNYEWYLDTYAPSITFPVNANENATATHAMKPTPFRIVTVTKTVVDPDGGYVTTPTPGKFSITLNCGGGYTWNLPLANLESADNLVPDGATCTITEAEPTVPDVIKVGYYNTYAISPQVFVVSGRNQNVSVTNRIKQGTPPPKAQVTVTKTVTDNYGGHIATNVFAIRVACAGTPEAVFNLMENQTGLVQGIVGEVCTITEPTKPSANMNFKYEAYIEPSKKKLPSTGIDATVENMVVPSSITLYPVTLVNAVTGDKAGAGYDADGSFTLTMACTLTPSINKTVTMQEGDESEYPVPSGSQCTMSTDTTAMPTLSNSVNFGWDATTYNPASPFSVNAPSVREVATHTIKALTEARYSTLEITPAGPLGTTYYATNNTYTVTVTAMNASSVPQPNQVIVVTVGGGTLAGTATGTFVPGTGACTTGASGTCVMTWTSATASPTTPPPAGFAINAKLGTDDIGNCGTEPNKCSPQRREFYGPIDPNQWTLTASPTTLVANGSSTSTVTATIKDASGNLVLAPTDVTFTSLASGYGSLSALTCRTQDGAGATPGACSVTYTSPTSVPAEGKATMTASVAGIAGNKTVDINLTSGGYYNVYVKKTVTGQGKAAGYVSGGAFTINVSCDLEPAQPPSLSLADLGEGYVVVKDGSKCLVTEVIPPATTVVRAGYTVAQVIAPSELTVNGGDETVEIVNRITTGDPGEMTVSKVISGDNNAINNGHIASNKFNIRVACTGSGLPDANFTLRGGQKATVVAGLGNECTISELEPLPAANTDYKYVSSIDPMFIPSLPASRDVTVTNTVVPIGDIFYKVTLKNVVDGASSIYDTNGTFKMSLICASFTVTPSLYVNEVSQYSVKSGSRCDVDTLTRPLIIDTDYGWVEPSTYSAGEWFTVNNNVNEVVTHKLDRTPLRWVTVTKTVNDPVGGYNAGQTFAITLNCGAGYTKVMNLAGGGSDKLQVPLNATCTLTEAKPAAGVLKVGYHNTKEINPSKFNVKADMTAAVTNRVGSGPNDDPATLEVTKSVTGPAVAHIAGNVFVVRVACATTPVANFNLQDGWSGLVEGKAGEKCTITEPTIPAANSPYHYVPNNTGTLTLKADPASGTEPGNKLTIENRAVQGTHVPVTLINAVTYFPPAIAPATPAYDQTQPFVLTMNCGPGYVWNNTSTPPMPTAYVGDEKVLYVPVNASCTMGTASRPAIVNTANYKWDTNPTTLTTYNPTSPFTAVAPGVTETATHRIIESEMRDIIVAKTVTGGTTDATFAIHVNCGVGSTRTMNLKDGQSELIQVKDGSVCEVTEDPIDIGGGNGYTALIVPSDFIVDSNLTVNVENRIEVGKPDIDKAIVAVTKLVNGETTQHVDSTTFNIHVDCVDTEPAAFSLRDGWSATVEAEVGKVCAITEPEPLPPLGGGYYYARSISPTTSTLPEDGLEVTVTNTVTNEVTRKLTLTNAVSGEPATGAYNHEHPFILTLKCGTNPDYDFGEVSMVVGAVSSYSIPNGARCDVDTVKLPEIFPASSYEWYLDTYNPARAFDMNADTNAAVTHAMKPKTFRIVKVTKTVDDPDNGYVAGSKFSITLNCGAGYTWVETLAHGETSPNRLVPDGNTCTITEAEPTVPDIIKDGYHNTSVISPSRFTVDGTSQDVNVTNRIAPGPKIKATVTVTKTVTGETDAVKTAGHIKTNAFYIIVKCETDPQAEFLLKENQSATVQGRVGQVCVIDEPAAMPPTTDPTRYWYAWNITPMETTLRAGGINVSVENQVVTKPVYPVVVSNVVTGLDLTKYNHNQMFKQTLNCGPGFTWDNLEMYVGDKAGRNVPAGESCTVSTQVKPSTEGDWIWFSEEYSITNPFTTKPEREDDVVTHTLSRSGFANVTVNKTLTGETTLYVSGPFDVTLSCSSGFSDTQPLTPTGSYTWTVPKGDLCTVTESADRVVLSDGTARRIIAPYQFTVGDAGQTVSAETELLRGPVQRVPLYVKKTVTGTPDAIANGHNPATVFDITVTCPQTSPPVKLLKLADGQIGMADAKIGDTCTVSEPTVPTAKFGYEYVRTSIIPSSLSMTGARNTEVVNLVRVFDGTEWVDITFAQVTVTDTAGSGYVPGVLNTTVNCGSGRVFSLPLAEGEQALTTVPKGTVCSSATAGTLPTLNSGYRYEGPTTTPPLPYTVNQNGTVTIHYGIRKIDANVPIPTLDPKALLLLIGLLSGLMLWRQSRQPRRQRVDQ